MVCVPGVHKLPVFNFHILVTLGVITFIIYMVTMTRCLLMKLNRNKIKAGDKKPKVW